MDFEVLFPGLLNCGWITLQVGAGQRLTLDEGALLLTWTQGFVKVKAETLEALRSQLLDCAAWVA